MPAYWLIKSEPEVYPYARLEADRRTEWTGVRNFEARNNLRAMRVGDLCLYYHSVSEKSLVGVARVTRLAGRDPTAEDGDWASVEVAPVIALARPVSLAQVKAEAALAGFALVTRSRLSVAPVSAGHFARVLELGGTRVPCG